MTLELVRNIEKHAQSNPANPAICGKTNIVTFEDLKNAIVNVSGTFAYRDIERGSKVFINILNEDLRLGVILACMHYGLVPFVIGHPRKLLNQIDFDLVVGSKKPFDDSVKRHSG